MPKESTIFPADAAQMRAAFAQPHEYLPTGHGRLAYWRFGRGPDVVLIHGWPLHAATFRHIVPELARGFTVHLLDLPGTGQSIEWSGPIDVASHAVVVRAAIDRLGLTRYALLAHDSGAAIARLVAAGDPRVQGLVLGNTEIPGHHSWVIRLYKWAAQRPRIAALMFSAMRVGLIRRSFLGFGGTFRDPAFVDGEFGEWFVRPLLTSREVARGQMALIRTLDFGLIDRLAEVHARIAAPVLFIWGTDDPFFPIGKLRSILHQFPGGAELAEIAGAKLLAHEDHPEAFVAYAVPFLARRLAPAMVVREERYGASSARAAGVSQSGSTRSST
jgi:pimeloyl-ACP methyl ester carboxylesterase